MMTEAGPRHFAPISFADTVEAFLCHGDPHLEELALESYREQGRGAVMHEDNPPHSFGIVYATLAELIADRDARADGELEIFADHTPAIPLVEQYDPSSEYVYVLSLDDDPPVYRTIRFNPSAPRRACRWMR
jgi:hypothetical protein